MPDLKVVFVEFNLFCVPCYESWPTRAWIFDVFSYFLNDLRSIWWDLHVVVIETDTIEINSCCVATKNGACWHLNSVMIIDCRSQIDLFLYLLRMI